MVDIPHIRREENLTAAVSPTTAQVVPEQKEFVQEAVSKALGAGVDYFQKEMEVAADDAARKGSNEYYRVFNQGYHIGSDGKQGLKNVEGLEPFQTQRDELTETLNKTTAELLSQPGLSNLAKEKLKLKLDEATSNFEYYMDTQGGQVKLKDKVTQGKIQLVNHGAILSSKMEGYIPKTENRAIHLTVENMKADYDTSMVSIGLGTKTVEYDKDGFPKTVVKLTPLGEYEKNKAISEQLGNAITGLASKNPTAALSALEKYRNTGDLLPETANRLEKSFKTSATLNEAYSAAFNSVEIEKHNPEEIKEKQKRYMDEGRPDLAKAYRQYTVDIANRNETDEKNRSEIAINNTLKAIKVMTAEGNPPLSLENALLNKDVKSWYDQIRPMDQSKIEQHFRAPRTSSLEATLAMKEFLLSGSTDADKFGRLWLGLSQKGREGAIADFADVRTDFKSVQTGGKSNKKATALAYVTEMHRRNKGTEEFYDMDDAEERIEAEEELRAWIKSSNVVIPDYDSDEGLENMALFVRFHGKNKMPKFLGAKKIEGKSGKTMTEAEKREANRLRKITPK